MGGEVTVVIVDFYTRELALALARDLESEDCVQEILIVDNTGDPEYQNAWESGGGKTRVLLSGQAAGYGHGLNFGARAASGSTHLLLSNSDLRVKSGTVRDLMRALEDRGLGAIGPMILDQEGKMQAISVGRFPDIRSGNDGPDWITGACILMSGDVFRDVGGFDESFHMYWEDVDFCRRLHEKGLRVGVDSKLTVQHRSGASIASRANRYAEARFGHQRYLKKWAPTSPRRHVVRALSAAKLCSLRLAELWRSGVFWLS